MTLEEDVSDMRFRRSRVIASLSMIVAIVAVTFALTLRAMESDTSPASHSQTNLTDPSAYVESPTSQIPSLSSLIGGLEARLEENPNDGRGWLLLAKSYEHLGRYDDAREAFAHAAALGATDDAVLRSNSTLTPQAAMELWVNQ